MRARVAALVASLAAGLASWPDPLLAVAPQLRSTTAVPEVTSRTPGIPAASTWDTFSADLTLRRRLLNKDGSPRLEAPEVRYRWVRKLGDAGWTSSLTVLSVAPTTVQTAKGPQPASMNLPISRVEIGDPRTPSRVFDTNGNPVFMRATPMLRTQDAGPGSPAPAIAAADRERRAGAAPAEAAPNRLDPALSAALPADLLDRASGAIRSRDWVEHLMPTAAGRATRRAALERDLGAPQGTVRGLDRFLSHANGAMTEVLADPAFAVPVEISVVENGSLVSHSTLSYEQDPGAGLVRRRLRTELLLSPESGHRSQVDVEFTNIRLDRGGVR
jgi:hypothetical protein